MDDPATALTAWAALGFTAAEARAWLAVGCTDPARTADLRDTGITPADMAACGLGPAYSDGDTSLGELLSVLAPEEGDQQDSGLAY